MPGDWRIRPSQDKDTDESVAGHHVPRHHQALGDALKARFGEIVERTEARSRRPTPSGKGQSADVTAQRHHAATVSTQILVDWLLERRAPDPDAIDSLARVGGQAAASNFVSLTEVMRSQLCFRDAVTEVLVEEAGRLLVPVTVVEEVLAGLRMSCDSFLMRSAKHFDNLAANMRDDLTQSHAELAFQACHDPLTRLANRHLFMEHLGRALSSLVPGSTDLAVLFTDLDRFKEVNDSYGHGFGDQVLVAIGKRLKATVRPKDLVSRFGGDEFVVLCHGFQAGKLSAMAAAEHLAISISQPLAIESRMVSITASIGVALTSGQGDDPETLVANADTAMYRAKGAGRARSEIFEAP